MNISWISRSIDDYPRRLALIIIHVNAIAVQRAETEFTYATIINE